MQREAGVATAIVELDALTNSIRSTAENDDLVLCRRRTFVGHFSGERRLIGRIHVGRWRREFGGAGIDALEHRADAKRMPACLHFGFGQVGEHGKPRVGKAHGLQRAQAEGVRRQAVMPDLGFHVDDGAHLGQEPRIDLAGVEDILIAPAEPHRLRHLQQAVRRRRAERRADRVLVVVSPQALDLDLV